MIAIRLWVVKNAAGLRFVEAGRMAFLSKEMEATGGFEPPNEGFAGPCLTTWLRRLWVLLNAR